VLEHLVGRDAGVEEEHTTLLQRGEHVITADVGGIVASHEVGVIDQPRHVHRTLAEAQVADGDAARLLGVIGEVGLGIHVGVLTDDLDRVLVGADGPVGSKTPEHAGDDTLGRDIDHLLDRQRTTGHVIDDTDGEVVETLAGEVLIDRLGMGRGEFFAGQTVAPTDNRDTGATGLGKCGHDILIQRLTEGTGLLGAVEHGNLFNRGGNGGHKILGRERTIQADLEHTDLGTAGVEVIGGPFSRVDSASHGDDEAVGIGSPDIVEQMVLAAGHLGDLVHVLLDDRGNSGIIRVDRFAALEIDVLILRRHFKTGRFGALGPGPEALDVLGFQQRLEVVVRDFLDLLHLVGSPETVEERQERNLSLQSGQMGDERQVHGLLDAGSGRHGITGVAARHDVGMVTENRQRLGCQGTGRHMEHRREHLSGNLMHVGDHQQQTLRCGECRCERTSAQRPVDGTCGSGFRLHLYDVHFLAEQILPADARPRIRILSHRGGGGDGIDRSNLAESVRDVRCRGIAVDSNHFLVTHCYAP